MIHRLRLAALVISLGLLFGPFTGIVRADEGPSRLDVESSYAWCAGAGTCDLYAGASDYYYASVTGITSTPPLSGKIVSLPQTLYAACSHAYTDATGVRRYDSAFASATYVVGRSDNIGRISGGISVPTPHATHTNTAALGALTGTAYGVTNTATVGGEQITNNQRGIVLSGGFHIVVSGVIQHFHVVVDPTFHFSYLSFDGTTNGAMTCSTVQSQTAGTVLLHNGVDLYEPPTD